MLFCPIERDGGRCKPFGCDFAGRSRCCAVLLACRCDELRRIFGVNEKQEADALAGARLVQFGWYRGPVRPIFGSDRSIYFSEVLL